VDLVTSILDAVKAVVTGGEFTTSIGKADKYLGIMNGGEGAWGGVGFAKWNEDMIKNSTVGAWNLGASGVQTLRVVFDPNFVDKTAMEQANRTLGSNVSWDVANSQFSRGASM
jgi:hypothetical protein